MVPSAAMGRDIPVAFQGGGPHAVVLLDAFNAAPDVSNWVTAGNAMNTLAGKGISVAAPAGGAWSMYTNWEQDGSKQWETFLADRAAQLAGRQQGPGARRARHRRVPRRAATAAMAMATFHPDRYRFAGSLSGFLTPSSTGVNGAITAGLAAVRRRRHPQHVGPATAGPVEVARPECPCAAAGGQQHPAVGVQPDDADVQRPRRDDRLLRSGPGQQPRRSTSTTARSAATTGTSTSRRAAATTGGAWSGQLAAMSGELVGHDRVAATHASLTRVHVRVSAGTLEAVQCSVRTMGRQARFRLLIASATAVARPRVSRCRRRRDGDHAAADVRDHARHRPVQRHAAGSPRRRRGQSNALVADRSAAARYLDALRRGRRQPVERPAGAVESARTYARRRAAKQTDQAVWDFVFPLVRSDVRRPDSSGMAPTSVDVNGATADYIRIATERLC